MYEMAIMWSNFGAVGLSIKFVAIIFVSVCVFLFFLGAIRRISGLSGDTYKKCGTAICLMGILKKQTNCQLHYRIAMPL